VAFGPRTCRPALPSSSSKGDSITKKTKTELEEENTFLKVHLQDTSLSGTGYEKVEKSPVVMSKISTSSNDLRVYWQG